MAPRMNSVNTHWDDWNSLFFEERRQDLRELTVDLTDRLVRLLEGMFKPDHSVGWESWLLRVCGESTCRQAVGIPAHYDQQQISSILIGDLPGLPRTQGQAVRMRVEIAFNLLAKVIAHPLCPAEITRFAKEFDGVHQSLRRASAHDEKWLAPDYREILESPLFTGFMTSSEEAPNIAYLRSQLRRKLRSCRQTQLDAEYYSLLLALDGARIQDRIVKLVNPNSGLGLSGADLQSITDRVLSCLLRLAAREDSFESTVLVWWTMAELFYAGYTPQTEEEGRGFDNLAMAASLYHSPFWKDESVRQEQGGSRRAPSCVYSDIEEYSEIPALPHLQLAFAAMAIFHRYVSASTGNSDGGRDSGVLRRVHELEAQCRGTLPEEGKCLFDAAKRWLELAFSDVDAGILSGSGGKGYIEQDDHGLLAVLATRLQCLLDFWRWQTFHEAIGCLTKSERCVSPGNVLAGGNVGAVFGTCANSPRNKIAFVWPIWQRLKGIPRLGESNAGLPPFSGALMQNSEEAHSLTDMAGMDYSFVLLGPPGIGKGAIVEELWLYASKSVDRNRVFYINRTPYELDSHWLDPERRTMLDYSGESRTLGAFSGGEGGPSSFFLVFIDEIHLPSVVSPYGLLLKPLQEGHPMLTINKRARSLYVFATSAYRSREHFLNAASERKDAAMRDFATRITDSHWITLPDLFAVPEQKFLVVSRLLSGKKDKTGDEMNLPEKVKTELAIGCMMNLGMVSVRRLKQTVAELEQQGGVGLLIQGVPAKFDSCLGDTHWPEWAKDLVKRLVG